MSAEPHGHTADLTAGWAIRSSADVADTGDVISQPGYGTAGWLPISRPETLMAGLLENGRYPDIFSSDNLASVDVTNVTIRNTTDRPTAAFFTRADVRRGMDDGEPAPGDNQVLPIRWSQNDVTLWPGQSQTLTARYRTADLHGAPPVVSVGGWNVATRVVRAG